MLGAAGTSWVHTPNLDRLAARSVRFEGAYCSNPMCVPSRFSMFTGRPASEVGIHAGPDSERRPVPESILETGLGWVMRAAGVTPLFGGKQHFPRPMTAEGIGFDDFEKDQRQPLAEKTASLLQQLSAKPREAPFLLIANLINPHDICHMGLRDFAQNDFEHALIRNSQTAIDELDRALALPPGMDEATFFQTICPALPDNFEPQLDEPEAIAHELIRRPFRRGCRDNWTEREWRLHRWAYARLTEKVDQEIGLILDALEASGLADDTGILFTSDHGDMAAAHRLEHKDVLYEEACRIPLLLHLPGMETSRIIGREWLANVGLDLAPTVCDWFDVPIPAHCSGQSILRPVHDPTATREVVPIESEIGHAVVGRRFKSCHYFRGEPASQWFDLETEPGEMQSCPIEKVPPEDRAPLEACHSTFHLFQRAPAKTERPQSAATPQ